MRTLTARQHKRIQSAVRRHIPFRLLNGEELYVDSAGWLWQPPNRVLGHIRRLLPQAFVTARDKALAKARRE